MKKYRIKDSKGKFFEADSLQVFAKEAEVYYGQLYNALNKGTPSKKGGYTVTQQIFNYVITDLEGKEHYVDSYRKFAKSVGVAEHGFKKCLRGIQGECYGGYTIRKTEPNEVILEELKRVVIPDKQSIEKDINLTKAPKLQILDVMKEGNKHRIKFQTEQGNICTRKVSLKRVDNLIGKRCDYSEVNIPMGSLYAECYGDNKTYTFCVEQIKSLGYEFKIDVDFNTKIVEKKVEVFNPTLLEEMWLTKQEKVFKEIAKLEGKLTKLRELKDYIGKNVASVKNLNSGLGKVDKMMEGCYECLGRGILGGLNCGLYTFSNGCYNICSTSKD